jgi:fatty acid desaturase
MLCARKWFVAASAPTSIDLNASPDTFPNPYPAPPVLPMAIYLDDTQRKALVRLSASWTWRTEWPTWALIVTIYGGWFGVAMHARSLGLPLTTALLALLSTWYMSLQHELLHGHPTRSRLINGLLGFAPLAVWFPYGIYRDSHLRHHADPHLTRPEHDPESYFVTGQRGRRAGPATRALLILRNTFAGRLVVGPAFAIAAATVDGVRKVARGDWGDVLLWIAHGASVAALAWWLQTECGIPAWLFVLGVGYSALSLSSIRSFQEHRIAESVEHRTVLNEAAWFWRLLFLNNNYHAVHHDLPHVPWFALRGVYEKSRQQYIDRSGGFLVKGYGEWLKLYALAPVAHPVYGDLSDTIPDIPPASDSFAGKLRVKFMIVIRRGELHEAHSSPTDQRQTAGQAL